MMNKKSKKLNAKKAKTKTSTNYDCCWYDLCCSDYPSCCQAAVISSVLNGGTCMWSFSGSRGCVYIINLMLSLTC